MAPVPPTAADATAVSPIRPVWCTSRIRPISPSLSSVRIVSSRAAPRPALTFTPVGTVESDSNTFSFPISPRATARAQSFVDVIGFSVYGNGGMNTDYPGVARTFPPGASGVFLGGRAGVNLQQALVSVAFAKQAGPLAIGIAPILAYQQFEAEGLQQAFGVKGSVTDRSFGFECAAASNGAVRTGLAASASPATRASGRRSWTITPGLFAEQGGFDIPASLQAGVAVDVSKNLTLLADYRHIWFGSVKSIAQSLDEPGATGL